MKVEKTEKVKGRVSRGAVSTSVSLYYVKICERA